MNRNVLLVYLRDLRDLEVVKYKLNSMYQQEWTQHKREAANIEADIAKLEEQDIWTVPEKESADGIFAFFLMMLIFSIILFVAFIILSIKDPLEEGSGVFLGIALVCLSVFGFFTYILAPNKGYKEEVAKVNEHNERERKRFDDNAESVRKKRNLLIQKKQEMNQRSDYLRAEYNKATEMLTTSYNVDILPSPYRNLQSVYYIYDYMSTSQSTLEETLFHEHMENGIQRILEKLDTIIAQNEEIIFQNRQIEANTREISDNTIRVLENGQRALESLERTEQNTLEAAQTAQIAANYSEINAFFSAANYLSK